ncbi:MAG TPA: ABC transporter ATP-binding protein, partial [Deltaproteobacteria bacterium]|nr:ABC transporter ATP-binding protein [Deltaproteobacteria bacterium]
MSHHIVEVRDLLHVYPDGTTGIDGISLRIIHGESVAVIGPNGAGKSTLLHHLNGFLIPTSGSVRIGDLPLTRKTLPEARRTVGMIFQDPDDQLFMPTIYDDVAFGPNNMGIPADEVDRRAIDALSRMGIEHLRDKPPYRLSSGEKRRAAIATVLSMMPDILVLDEPTTGLDPFARRQLIGILKEFTHTKIIATHDLDL